MVKLLNLPGKLKIADDNTHITYKLVAHIYIGLTSYAATLALSYSLQVEYLLFCVI